MESITYVVSSRGDVPSPVVPAILFKLLDRIAKQKGTTPAQIALAWLLAQKPWIVPIRGTTKLSRLDENIGSLAINLTFDDLREIDSAASKITVEGDRYPEHLLRMSGLRSAKA